MERTIISERTMLQDIAVVVLLLPVATTGLLLDRLEYRNCSTPLGNAPLDNEVSELASSHCPPWFTNETGKCRPGPNLVQSYNKIYLIFKLVCKSATV